MDINYPAYVWTHNGWVQQMDASYSVHQWDREHLVVHVVPFSHNDPGLCYCLVHRVNISAVCTIVIVIIIV